MTAGGVLPGFAAVPKTELHLHLEGAIPLHAMRELMKKYGGDPSVADENALRERFTFRDFPHFIETWVWKNGFIREYEDFTFIAREIASDLARQKVVYAEVFYSPAGFADAGLDTREITLAIDKGLKAVKGTEVALILDFIRDLGPERAERTLAEVFEVKSCGVIGVGIGGMERDFPAGLFTAVYGKARKLGFRLTAHAGEAAGAQSIRDALESLGAERIGHGVRAYEDEELLRQLVKHGIPLEMCPISNVKTGVVARMEEHPVRRYFDLGIAVTISTDDPMMFGNSLEAEYESLVRVFGFSRKEIRELMANSIRASWMPEEKKPGMIAELDGYFTSRTADDERGK